MIFCVGTWRILDTVPLLPEPKFLRVIISSFMSLNDEVVDMGENRSLTPLERGSLGDESDDFVGEMEEITV